MERRVLAVRHGDEPLDDRATAWLRRARYVVETRCPYRGETLGVPISISATVIYGGRDNVYETGTYPFLPEEYQWIDACLKAGVKVLGTCQEALMIAHHLGAWAGPRKREIFEFDYYEITPTAEAGDFLTAPLTVCQAHFHTFDLPSGAERSASNDNYENQAIRLEKNVYGLQFHPEVTKPGFRRWQREKAHVYRRRGVQDRVDQDRLLSKHDALQGAWFEGFLENFTEGAA